MLISISKVLLALVGIASLSACDVPDFQISIAAQNSKQPERGVGVVVVPIDERQFEAEPREPSTPSLSIPEQISNRQVTSKAVGRTRNLYGKAQLSVFLAPPETAASLVADAVKAGLRDSGYRVLNGDDPAAYAAPMITVHIAEFWTWAIFGNNTVKFGHGSLLTLEGDIPALRSSASIRLREIGSSLPFRPEEWTLFITTMTARLRSEVSAVMRPRMAALN